MSGRAAWLGLLLLAATAEAAVLRVGPGVKEGYPTVQAAIDEAAEGDTVSLAPGTYAEALRVTGKRLLLRGEGNAEDTVLEGSYRTKLLDVRASGGLRVTGLTFRRGGATGVEFPAGSGGAVTARASVLEVTNCRFEDNQVLFTGGAIHASRFDAGGSVPPSAAPGLVVEDCVFLGNGAGDEGGAVFVDGVPARFRNVVFAGNAGLLGGALATLEAAVTVEDGTFSGNRARLDGGAISAAGPGPLVIRRARFTGDTAERRGGSLSLLETDAQLEESAILGGAAARGGGLAAVRSDLAVDRTIVADATGTVAGGGAYLEEMIGLTWSRGTFAGNMSPLGPSLYLTGTTGTVEASLVLDPGEAIRCAGGATVAGACNLRAPETLAGCLAFAGTSPVARCPADPAGLCTIPQPEACGTVGHAETACGDPACLTPVERSTWGRLKSRFADAEVGP